MVYCPKCGTQNQDEAEFCMKCGFSLKGKKDGWLSRKNPFAWVTIIAVIALLGFFYITVIPQSPSPTWTPPTYTNPPTPSNTPIYTLPPSTTPPTHPPTPAYTLTPQIPIITPDDAHNYYGKLVIVEGLVVYTYNSGNACFLDFHQDWSTNPNAFVAVIFASDFGKFSPSPESYYLFKKVRVKGIITQYNSKPEIILNSPSQIWIVE